MEYTLTPLYSVDRGATTPIKPDGTGAAYRDEGASVNAHNRPFVMNLYTLSFTTGLIQSELRLT